jgi:hypothetical protein
LRHFVFIEYSFFPRLTLRRTRLFTFGRIACMRVHPTCPSSSGALVLTCANPCHARVCIRDPLSCSPAPALGNGSKLNRKRAERSCTCALLKASLHAHGLCTAEILSVACPLSQLARPTLGTSGAIPFAMLQSTRCQRGMVTNADARARFIAHNAIEYVDPPQRKVRGWATFGCTSAATSVLERVPCHCHWCSSLLTSVEQSQAIKAAVRWATGGGCTCQLHLVVCWHLRLAGGFG